MRIPLDLGRGDLASAFQHAERLRGAAGVNPDALAGTQTNSRGWILGVQTDYPAATN